jgi:hypothetical protein
LPFHSPISPELNDKVCDYNNDGDVQRDGYADECQAEQRASKPLHPLLKHRRSYRAKSQQPMPLNNKPMATATATAARTNSTNWLSGFMRLSESQARISANR